MTRLESKGRFFRTFLDNVRFMKRRQNTYCWLDQLPSVMSRLALTTNLLAQ